MAHYNAKGEITLNKWRRFANETMERFPPSFLMVLFLLALYFALDVRGQIPAVDWIFERFGIGITLWKVVFLVGAVTIAYFRPAPRYVLLLSLPAAFLGGGILWYGVVAQRDVVAMMFIGFCWLAIGMAMVAMVMYQEQLIANELLAEKVNAMQKEKEQANAPHPTAPAQS